MQMKLRERKMNIRRASEKKGKIKSLAKKRQKDRVK